LCGVDANISAKLKTYRPYIGQYLQLIGQVSAFGASDASKTQAHANARSDDALRRRIVKVRASDDYKS
jgi:hypothetical protein